jgi:hypothetical protein
MERLTKKDGAGRNFVDVKRFDDDEWIISEMADGVTIKFSSRAIDKLAEFEDFMEENEWDSIEEMKSALNQCEQKHFKMQRDYEELKHCIWKDTPIEQIRNNYERGHNFDFVGVAYNRGKAKIDRKVRKENQALKERWEKLREYIECCKDDAPFIFNKMQELEEEE